MYWEHRRTSNSEAWFSERNYSNKPGNVYLSSCLLLLWRLSIWVGYHRESKWAFFRYETDLQFLCFAPVIKSCGVVWRGEISRLWRYLSLLRCLSKKLLGADEYIRVYCMQSQKALGEFSQHRFEYHSVYLKILAFLTFFCSGAITVVKFYEDSFLFCGSEVLRIASLLKTQTYFLFKDNAISVWRTYDWTCLHLLGGEPNMSLFILHHFSLHCRTQRPCSRSRHSSHR